MNRTEFEALENRIRTRADRLWQDAGSPDGEQDNFLQDARELVALEEVEVPTLDPYDTLDTVEEASLQRNLGEFPTLVDQGDEQTFPDDIASDDDDDIHLSDGDASEQGGVLPDDDRPQSELADISVADADITSDVPEDDDDLFPEDDLDDDLDDDDLEGEGDPENDDLGGEDPDEDDLDDLNDDGVRDEPPFRGPRE